MPTPTADTVAENRYQHFRDTLRKAAEGSASDYDGLGPFWELPLERLLEVSLYGVRLIAPESDAKPSCCSHHDTSAGDSRAARSGLIQGLLGESPFDGSRFP